MTKVTFYKRDGFFYGFEETGHTGYGESGEDVLCASLSAMTMLVVNAIEISYATDISYVIDENSAKITVTAKSILPECKPDEKKQYAVSGLFMGYYYQLMDLTEEYYDYLEVEIVNDDSDTDNME